MSVSFMEKLLDGVAVEYLPMGHPEVGEFIRGGGLQKKDFTENGVGCIHYGQIYTHYGTCAEKTKTYVSEEFFKKARKAKTGNLVIATTSENDEDVCKAVAWLGNEEIAVSSDACIYRHKLHPKYVSYFFQTERFQKQKRPHITGTKVRRVNADDLAKLQIPIPCPDNPKKSLEIQAEIVRILDAFTALTTELTTELTTRKKQYNYYRDKLLSFEEGEVEWKTLDDVVLFRRGSFPQPYGNSEWYDGEGSMPFVQVADVSDSGFTLNRKTKQRISKLAQPKSVFVEAGTVIVSLQGTIGRVAITQYDCYVDRTLAIFTDYKESINKKYFAYQLKSKFDVEKEYARGSTLKTITKEEFSKFEIPIPPVEEQARIVAILDKFDALTNSISEGLPREIELRQKQYEYYRDMLLSFPQVDEMTI